ncbi:sugar ABC transporter permease [Spirochaetia bacterium]|nr:sugar ABC transporter permease [Spirochaetia bacterium]
MNYSRQKEAAKIFRVAVTVLVAFFALLCVMPFIWMISTSFKFEIDVMNFPFKLVEDRVNLTNYATVWFKSNFPLFYFNSIKVTFLSLLGNLCLTTMAAYAFGRLRFRGKEIIFSIYLATLMIPDQVTILPKYLYFGAMHITNSHLSLILPAIFNVFGTFLMRGYFETIPFEITEAAVVDGAGQFRIFSQVIMPLAPAGVMTLMLLSFSYSWNEYLAPLIFLTAERLFTITIGLQYFMDSSSTNFALIMAGATLSVFPVLIFFLFSQRYFIESFAAAGIKG